MVLLIAVLPSASTLEVIIPNPTYEYARGDDVILPCTYKSKVTNPPLVVISWSVEGTVANSKETLILSYYHPSKVTDIKKMYEGRVSIDVDPNTGKANLKISRITLEDNKIFECRVLIPGDDEGTPADTARLVVLVAPSTPVCKIQGKAEYGQNINLTCKSEEGSPPPTYKWESRDVKNMPRVPDPRTTDKGGILSLYNISRDTSGYYLCTSSNKIRSASCNITLTVMPPSMNIGSTAGIIAGVVILLILLIIIIYCCCCRKKNKEEEYAMGVREEEFRDKEPDRNGESRHADGQESPQGYDERKSSDRRDQYDERSDYDNRRDYDERHSDYDDRRSDYDDRRRDYDNRRSDYDDRHSNYDERRSDYTDRHDRYSDRHERYDDDRYRDSDRRDRRDADDDDRYDEPYDDRDRPPVPANKPKRMDYDD